jgi:hypothetical protein
VVVVVGVCCKTNGFVLGVRGCGVVAILSVLLKLNTMTRSADAGS